VGDIDLPFVAPQASREFPGQSDGFEARGALRPPWLCAYAPGVRYPKVLGPGLVIIQAPVFDQVTDLVEAGKPVFIQEFHEKSAIKAFNVGALHGFSRLDLLQCDLSFYGPIFQGFAGELRAVVATNLKGHYGGKGHRHKAEPIHSTCPPLIGTGANLQPPTSTTMGGMSPG